jgi:hypothetical protein
MSTSEVAVGRRRIHCRYHPVNMPVNCGPLGVAKHHQGDLAAFQILLLIPDAFIGGKQNIKPRL